MQAPDQPVLYAALICERASLDEDGVPILFRVVDNFLVRHSGLVPGALIEIPFALYTKWGGPAGQYAERVVIVDGQGQEHDLEDMHEIKFDLQGGHHFRQIRHFITLPVRESGPHVLRVYLNEVPYIDVPLRINFESEPSGG